METSGAEPVASTHRCVDGGGHYAVSINVGGDPTAISFASSWESLGEYERLRAAFAADTQLQSLTRVASGFMTGVQDTIAQVIKAPAGRGSYAQVNTAMMHMPAVVDATGFAVEIAEFVDQKLGRSVGVLTAMTGNRAGLMSLGDADSLDRVAADSQTLETDPDYLAFFKRSESLFAPGTLE